jgi:hypothetical protein
LEYYVSIKKCQRKNYDGIKGIQLALGRIQWWVWLMVS